MAMSKSQLINSVLVLDDNPDSLVLISEMLSHRLAADVVQTRFPSEAVRLANERFFDLAVLDVTINYRGSHFGGLDVYGELLPRYGSDSIVAYSEVVTDSMLKQYPFVDNFVDKHMDPVVFADKLADSARRLRERQSCFVAMPFSPDYDSVYEVLRTAVKNAGFRPVRVDEQEFTASIVERILAEIRNAKLVIFVATDRNPNAFYECGYSVALNKEVITVTDDLASLPFDLRDRNALSYDKSFDVLSQSLERRLVGLTKPR
jgi:CheY-like chemotaxis protein